MSALFESNISKGRRIAGLIVSILPSLMIAFSGFSKVTKADEMVQNMSAVGLGDKVVLIGAIELIALALYWIPKTSSLGFALMASYAGGIIAIELTGGAPPLPGLMVAVLFYVGTYLRKPSLSGLGI
ncbi:MAG TPA: hypothetical protein DCP28_18630 [Cytophagales bacterium]|nr:hypothetical protein [Cytophagales bacterium]